MLFMYDILTTSFYRCFMKHQYEKPILDVVEMNAEDIIKTSSFDKGDTPDEELDW